MGWLTDGDLQRFARDGYLVVPGLVPEALLHAADSEIDGLIPDDLIAGVVAGGQALLAPTVTRRLMEEFVRRPSPARAEPLPGLERLTERETEVLIAVARGLSNVEIADTLFISPATAKTQVSRLLTKLHARDRAQLVMLAYEAGVVAPGVACEPRRRRVDAGALRCGGSRVGGTRRVGGWPAVEGWRGAGGRERWWSVGRTWT